MSPAQPTDTRESHTIGISGMTLCFKPEASTSTTSGE